MSALRFQDRGKLMAYIFSICSPVNCIVCHDGLDCFLRNKLQKTNNFKNITVPNWTINQLVLGHIVHYRQLNVQIIYQAKKLFLNKFEDKGPVFSLSFLRVHKSTGGAFGSAGMKCLWSWKKENTAHAFLWQFLDNSHHMIDTVLLLLSVFYLKFFFPLILMDDELNHNNNNNGSSDQTWSTEDVGAWHDP